MPRLASSSSPILGKMPRASPVFESDPILHLHRGDWTYHGEDGTKRRVVSSQAQAPSAKRRRSPIFHDQAIKSEEESSHTLPCWGARRVCSALGGGGTHVPHICWAKRARSATEWYVQFHFQGYSNLTRFFVSIGETGRISAKGRRG